jgi:hypothetical protein
MIKLRHGLPVPLRFFPPALSPGRAALPFALSGAAPGHHNLS